MATILTHPTVIDLPGRKVSAANERAELLARAATVGSFSQSQCGRRRRNFKKWQTSF